MDPFSFPPVAALLDGAYAVVVGLVDLLEPLAGNSAAALAIVAVTVLVRAVLIPVGAARRRAELGRLRLAPQLAELRRRFGSRPAVLNEKTLELYRRERVSPFAGIGPTLAQAPVLSLVYAVFAFPQVNGHANALLVAHLGPARLGVSLVHTIGSTPVWPTVAVYAGVLVAIATTAALTRHLLRPAEAASVAPASTDASPESAVTAALSWLPFLTVLVAAFVPLAAALYLAVSTAWTLVETRALRRRMPNPG